MKFKNTLLLIMSSLCILIMLGCEPQYNRRSYPVAKPVLDTKAQAAKCHSSGFKHFTNKNYDLAIIDFNKAIELKPDDWNVYFYRGTSYSRKGDDGSAIADYSKAIQFKSDYAVLYSMRAISYRNKGDYDSAIADYNRVIQLEPDNESAYLNRISACKFKGDYDRIIADCSKVIQLDPDSVSIYCSRGEAYCNKGDYDDAIADYSKAIGLEPGFEWLYCLRGKVYEEKEDYDRAIADYNKASKLNPKYSRYLVFGYRSRGYFYSRKGNFLLAENDFEQAMQLASEEENAKLFIDWAIFHQRAGNAPERIKSQFALAWESDRKFVRIITNWVLKSSQDIESTGNKLINITQGYMLYPKDIVPLCKMLALCAPEHDIITHKQARLLDPTLKFNTASSVEVVRRRQAVSAGTRDTKNAWAVVVGVAEYQYAQDGVMGNLVFAQKDADDFYSVLQNQGWAKDHIYKLTNEKANKRNIEYAMETWLRKAKPEDMIIVFWSSHAWPDPGDSTKAYFACYDSKPSDPSSGWRMDRVLQILEERNVKNVVMIADTCHAGKIIRAGDPKAIGVIPALEKMNTDRTIPNGWIFIASADSDRKAYEDKAWSNGALTHVLIEGISGQADGYQSLGPKDGSITIGELRGYVTDRMSEESLNILGARLTPLFYTTSTLSQLNHWI